MRVTTNLNGVEYDNMSVDNKVGFIEDTHTYKFVDRPGFKFTSVTTVIKEYKEEFDALAQAKRSCSKSTSKYFGMDPVDVAADWRAIGDKASAEGTRLHEYGEFLLNGDKDAEPPGLTKETWVPEIIDELWRSGYELAKTELLVYSEALALAGQSDILLKKKRSDGEYDYMIYDWKFLGKKLPKKSFYNTNTRKYVKMSGPFKHLMDCKWINYSIQLAIYQTLTGAPENIKEKVLVVVYDKGYELVPSYPMRVFWDENLELQAVYETWNGKFYDSRTDKVSNVWPKDIKGR